MKDVHTLNGEPARLTRWVQIARNVTVEIFAVSCLFAAVACAEVQIPYSLASSGQVSLAVYRADGQFARTLLSGVPQARGKHKVVWDGLDWTGRPMAPGKYEWRLLQSPGLKAEYLLSIGTSYNIDEWPGNHGGPHDVACDGELGIVANGGEVTTAMAASRLSDGAISGQTSDILPGDIAAVKGRLFVLGKRQGDPAVKLWSWTLEPLVCRQGRDVTRVEGDRTNVAQRVAANSGHLAVLYADGRIEWLAPEGALATLGTALVPGAKDIALTPAGNVLAIAGNSLWEVSRGDTNPVERLNNMKAPIRLAVDESNGDILVVNGSSQIERHAADFRFVQAYGRSGGRQQGLYNANDFMAVSDICADHHGGFMIVENWSAPRRMAHFGSDGKVLREWYGGQLFFTLAGADPADVSRVWLNSHWGWMMETEVDYKNRTWKPRATYVVQGLAGGLFGADSLGLCGAMRRHGENRYIVRPGGPPSVLWVDEANRCLVPMVAGAINTHSTGNAIVNKLFVEKNAGKGYNEQCNAIEWQDANGDGAVQAEVFRLTRNGGWNCGWTMDDDFTYYSWNAVDKPQQKFVLRKLAVTRWEGARPVYPAWDEAIVIGEMPVTPEMMVIEKDWGGMTIRRATNDSVYQIVKGQGDGFTADYLAMGHSGLWSTSLSGSYALNKWDPRTGLLQWRVGKLATTGKDYVPGQIDEPMAILGQVHGCVLLAQRMVMPLVAWTEDGLYRGALLNRRADDGLPESCYSWWRSDCGKDHDSVLQYDMYVGGSIHELPNGDLVYFGAGWNRVPVYRISGWNDCMRQSGTVKLKHADNPAAASGTGLRAEYFANTELAGAPVLRCTNPVIWFGNPDTKTRKAWPPGPVCEGAFSARWTGFIESHFSEDYELKIYLGIDRKAEKTDCVRVWVGNKLVLDAWEKPAREMAFRECISKFRRIFGDVWNRDTLRNIRLTAIVPLRAGEKTPIRIEYAKTSAGYLHLAWESRSQEIEHVPASALYP